MTPEQLKASILKYAMQGKLVEQKPEEGTGEELYQQMQTDKQMLIREKKIKKEKPLADIIDDEIPFDIPESWKWVKVGNVGSWSAGATPPRTNPAYYGGSIPWLKTGDLNDGFVKEVPEYITDLALEKTSVRLNPIGSVLMAMYGATIGKLGILEIPVTTNQACCACIPYAGMYNKYLFYYLMSMRKTYIGMAEGGAQPNISKEKIVNSLIPLPPAEEQKRIVAKIEELLPYVDRYAAAYEKLEQFNAKFPEDMKKSILQYAIQGKLVEQKSEEGTGEELYRRIQYEKQRLIQEGKIKKEKPLAAITDDEIPFEIPESWKWVRFGEVYSLSNGTASRGTKGGIKHPVLRLADLSGGAVDVSNIRSIELAEKEYLSHQVVKDDLIFIRVNGTKARVATAFHYKEDNVVSYCDHLFCGHKVSEGILVEYMMYIFNAASTRKQLLPEIKTTAGQNTISQASMAKIIIPLPPLAEQKRIVAKLEEILPLCERLK